MMAQTWRFLSAMSMLSLTPNVTVDSAQSGIGEVQRLAGCFEVSFRFAEDRTQDIFAERYRLTNPTKEWVGLKQTSDNTFVLQHVLFAGPKPFPHWHEVWTWHQDRQAWTQEARGGAAGPTSQLRYRCTAPWTGNRWECHAGRAEKPLRDEKRDYDWLDRRNHPPGDAEGMGA